MTVFGARAGGLCPSGKSRPGQSVPPTMACCKAPVETDEETLAASKTIDSQIKQDRRDEANRITLLLLGTHLTTPFFTAVLAFICYLSQIWLQYG